VKLVNFFLLAAITVTTNAALAVKLTPVNPEMPLNNCGGIAKLENGRVHFFRVQAGCDAVYVNDARVGAYTLRFNANGLHGFIPINQIVTKITIANGRNAADTVVVDLRSPTVAPAPAPVAPGRIPPPRFGTFPKAVVVPNGQPVPLPSCGGFVSLTQSALYGLRISFTQVNSCTYYQVLRVSRADTPVYIDETAARLRGVPGNYVLINQPVPSKWTFFGQNQTVLVRLQSRPKHEGALPGHAVDIVVNFNR